MKQIDTIRAALERGLEVLPTYAKTYAQLAEALTALAELEKAAAEPVGVLIQEIDGSPGVVWADVPAWGTRLYAAPPAPVAEIREPTYEAAMRVWECLRYSDVIHHTHADEALEWLTAWRAELGPALGLVALKEPTPEECADMAEWFKSECAACCINPQEAVDYGRAIFDAVRIVMWPKEGL